MPLGISALASNAEGVLLITTPEGAFRSVDGAQTWQGFGPASASSASANSMLLAVDSNSGRVLLSAGDQVWGYNIPSGVVALKTPTAPAAAELPPTPPPPPPPPATDTPVPPTATATHPPTPTPTVQVAARPAGWLPSDRVQPLDPSFSSYFPQTGHNIKHGFRDYWINNGAEGLLGYPLTEEFTENGATVQYFERVRLEYRNGKIIWGLLGTELTAGRFFKTVRFFPSEDNKVYFGPTQHSASGPFLQFWRDNGGLDTFGYPISESYKDDGSEYQWFERARLEWHSNLPEGKRIVLGLLGKEALQKRGWIK
jgi:hypothetical protein